MNEFENVIKCYLEEMARKDKEFALKYGAEGKTIEECCNYIISEVEKSGRHGFCDEEVYGMAIHYYDEPEVEIDGRRDAKVVVNHAIELTPEEIEEARAKAKEQIQREEEEKMRRDRQTAVEKLKKAEERKKKEERRKEYETADLLFAFE